MNVKQLLVIATSSILASSYIYASDESRMYLGLKTGQTKFDDKIKIDSAVISANDDISYGVVGGYKLTSQFAIELEYTTIETDTEVVNYCKSGSCSKIRGDIEVDTYALYGVYRTSGDLYFKARAGYLYEEVSLVFLGDTFDTKHEREFTASIGGGIKLNLVNIEAEYTSLDSGINLFSLGVTYGF